MPKTKVAVTIERDLVDQVDQLVAQDRFRNRSQAIECALSEKVERITRNRLARECAKLDRDEEKRLAEAGLADGLETWPEYGGARSAGPTSIRSEAASRRNEDQSWC
jgi:Arc/MetJ-type ribon-helix-helix transcriptional regulator